MKLLDELKVGDKVVCAYFIEACREEGFTGSSKEIAFAEDTVKSVTSSGVTFEKGLPSENYKLRFLFKYFDFQPEFYQTKLEAIKALFRMCSAAAAIADSDLQLSAKMLEEMERANYDRIA